MRINKALALAKVASRRGADTLIQQGRVQCNGVVVRELGLRISPQDSIHVDGNPIEIPHVNNQYHYIVLNKPVQYISSVSDPQGRKTVLSLLPVRLRKERLYPVGRLDYFSEGLLLLSNDGALTYRLTHPKYHIEKEYRVAVRSPIDEKALFSLASGFELSEKEKLAPMQTKILKRTQRETVFSIILRQGVNRQIRRICQHMGWTILWLERIRIGSLYLEKLDIERGAYRVFDKSTLEKLIFG